MTLTEQLRRDEGVRRTLYYDSRHLPTIGVGHNLAVPLSDAAIDQILSDDLLEVDRVLSTLPWIAMLSDARLGVLRNMCFNLGFAGLLGFREMTAALQHQDWATAAAAMLDSAWAEQVGPRAHRLSMQMRTDVWV